MEAIRRWLTPTEAAEILPQTEQVIRRLLREGRIPGRKVEGRWSVDMKELGFYEGGEGAKN